MASTEDAVDDEDNQVHEGGNKLGTSCLFEYSSLHNAPWADTNTGLGRSRRRVHSR